MMPLVANGTRLRVDLLSTWAIAGAVCGLLAAIGPLPSALKAPLLLAFVFLGPGSAVLQYWAAALPAIARRALVPILGLSIVFLVLTASLLLGYWSPRVLLLGLAVATVIVGVVNRQRFDIGGGADDRSH
jgi:hypothetical protein